MATAPVAATGYAADYRSSELDLHHSLDHCRRFAHRFARVSLGVLQYRAEYAHQLRWIAEQRGIFRRRRLLGRRRLVGRRRCFGELVMDISKEDHDRITSAIRTSEAKTSGEIVCVLARSSSHAAALPVFIAAVVALAAPWLLVAFTAMTVQRILSLQVFVFLVLLVISFLPSVQVALMPRKARRVVAHRVAMEQFISRGMARNEGPLRNSDFCVPCGALCAHHRWRIKLPILYHSRIGRRPLMC